jgi:epoxide hydrolase-like predicted phosphatase
MSIKAIVSDFGGVLVRSEDESGRSDWEKRCNLKKGDLSHLVFDSDVAKAATIGQATERDVWEHVYKTLNLSADEAAEIKKDFWAGDRLDYSLVTFIQGFKPQLKTALLSNAWDNARKMFIEEFSLGDIFDDMIISAEVGIKKPDPAIFTLLINHLGVRSDEIIFIDDFPDNITTAASLGIHTILFRSTSQVVEETNMLLEQN